jgi:hypothetical protein
MWQTPRTDWKWTSEQQGDFFECGDYNRIKNNIDHLHILACGLYKPFEISDMGRDKTVADYPYADEINRLADNIETVSKKATRWIQGIRPYTTTTGYL